MALANSRRQFLEFLCVPSADHEAVRQERLYKRGRHFRHGAPPRGFPQSLQSLTPQRFPQRLPASVRELAKLQGKDDFLRDQRRADSSAQTEEAHTASSVPS